MTWAFGKIIPISLIVAQLFDFLDSVEITGGLHCDSSNYFRFRWLYPEREGNHIDAMVSKTIIEMNKQIPVKIVTARATDKSMKEAKEMLLKAGLSHIPIFSEI